MAGIFKEWAIDNTVLLQKPVLIKIRRARGLDFAENYINMTLGG